MNWPITHKIDMKKTYFFLAALIAASWAVASQTLAADAPAALPDLSVSASDIKFTPATFRAGSKVLIKAVVKNTGGTKAQNFYVALTNDGVPIYEKKISSLAKGAKATISFSYAWPVHLTGNHLIGVLADSKKTLTETGKDNNFADKNIDVWPPQQDLYIESVTPSVKNPKAGQQITWKIKIGNSGSDKAQNFKVILFADNQSHFPTNTINITSLSPKSKRIVTAKWTVPFSINPAVNYPVRAYIDPDNLIRETNEMNNDGAYSLTLNVPDLVIEPTDASFTPKFTYSGFNTALNVRVRNNGSKPVTTGSIGLYYYLASQPDNLIKIDEQNLATIAKNWWKTFYLSGKIPTTVPIGTTIGLVALADNGRIIPEKDENNNKLDYPIVIRQKPAQLSCPCMFINVSDEDGNPLNGAVVKLDGTETKTTANGSVIFENRPNSASYALSITYPEFRGLSQTVNYNKDNEDSTYFNYQMDKRALLTGTVRNGAGQPLPWASVRVDGLGLESVTDASGKYGFLLNGGTYTLRFVREGYNRVVEPNYNVPALGTVTLDKTMAPGTTAYFSGRVTDDEGSGLGNVDIYVNNTMLGTTAADGKFNLNIIGANGKKFTFKKPSYINTEFTEDIKAGNEYYHDLVMYKPNTDTHVERGANLIAWHQHEGTPANAFFIPEYNVDVWWGLGNVKLGLDFAQSNGQTKLTKLVANVHGREWECNKVEGEGEIETSAIDVPITIAAGSCSNKQTQFDVYKVAIESNGQEVWSDSAFWSSASDPNNTGTKVFQLNNLPVDWNNNLKVKLWVRAQKKAPVGTDGDGAGALYGYNLDKKLITWYPQKPPTTKVSTSWKQIGGYFLGILDNPVNAVTGFMDTFTVDQFNQYTMEEVLPQNFPGAPPAN